ncbi:MAG: hypothetical protein V3U30_03670 [Thermoplasmata archaeon]
MDKDSQSFEETVDPVLSFGVIVRARMSKIKELAESLATDPDVRIVITKTGGPRSLWLVDEPREKGRP